MRSMDHNLKLIILLINKEVNKIIYILLTERLILQHLLAIILFLVIKVVFKTHNRMLPMELLLINLIIYMDLRIHFLFHKVSLLKDHFLILRLLSKVCKEIKFYRALNKVYNRMLPMELLLINQIIYMDLRIHFLFLKVSLLKDHFLKAILMCELNE